MVTSRGEESVKRTVSLLVAMGACLLAVAGTAGPAMASSPIKITAAYYDPVNGPDPATNAYRNKEFIVVRNSGVTAVNLGGWTLRDLARPTTPAHVYKFPTFKLGPGQSVRIHTGKGLNSATDLYWGLTIYVWGDDSDTATLKNPTGSTVSSCSWITANSSPKFC